MSDIEKIANTDNASVLDNTLTSYHTPTLITYGGLSDLIQNNPSVGSDAGAGDCSHL